MRSFVIALFLSLALPTAGSAATVAFGATLADNSGGFVPSAGSSVGVSDIALSPEITDPVSEWIWSDTPTPVVTYTFSFDLTGYDTATASLTGLYGAKDYVQVVLNGTQLGVLPFFGSNSAALTSYGTSSDALFNQGVNTLSFVAIDLTSFGAFRATAEVEATLTGIPVPASGALLLLALAGASLAMRRRDT